MIDPDIQRSNISCVLFPWLRVCYFSFFLSFLFLFLPTFSIFFSFTFMKLVKPVKASHQLLKKVHIFDLASSRSNAHTHTNKGGAKRRGKAERRQRAVHRLTTRFVDYELMFDSQGVHLVSKMICFVHRINNPQDCSVQRAFFYALVRR